MELLLLFSYLNSLEIDRNRTGEEERFNAHSIVQNWREMKEYTIMYMNFPKLIVQRPY